MTIYLSVRALTWPRPSSHTSSPPALKLPNSQCAQAIYEFKDSSISATAVCVFYTLIPDHQIKQDLSFPLNSHSSRGSFKFH
ncbi:hypothetical protein JOB18_026618 [Solea senegalensis]|uniref:Uncharacterized protein n=1 Tax=Solea senegalensis TaxID=28829 RepID=A0AAV6RZ30_SOLSE|nr:hypothetical protein JOB18_026618 [Solea senegalensis]